VKCRQREPHLFQTLGDAPANTPDIANGRQLQLFLLAPGLREIDHAVCFRPLLCRLIRKPGQRFGRAKTYTNGQAGFLANALAHLLTEAFQRHITADAVTSRKLSSIEYTSCPAAFSSSIAIIRADISP